jgi:hypothetical protein
MTPEARLTFASTNADGTRDHRVETLDGWIARLKSRGHATLDEKQLNFRIDRFGDIAHLWSLYLLHSDGQTKRGVNSIDAIREADGWRITGITVQGEPPAAPLPEEYLP